MTRSLTRFLRQLLSWTGLGVFAAGSAVVPAFGALPDGTSPAFGDRPEPLQPLIFERPNHNELQLFAGHSSHSSHSSHASHASHSSHYSGSGGAYPAPQTQSPAPSEAAPPAPAQRAAPLSQTPSEKLVMVMRVQSKLHELGYYAELVDGQPGPATRDALRRYQAVKGFPVTGKMDDTTLAALGITY